MSRMSIITYKSGSGSYGGPIGKTLNIRNVGGVTVIKREPLSRLLKKHKTL